MEVQTAQPASGSTSSSAAYPSWVIFEGHCNSMVHDDISCATAAGANAKTLAAARTSNGHPIQVSLSLAEPPATSSVRVKLPDGVLHRNYCFIMAAHSDFLLIVVQLEQGFHRTLDYFVYNAGDAAAHPPRPPSLSLLPCYYPSESEDSCRRYPGLGSGPVNREMHTDHTGILHPHRGEDEVVVAELKMVVVSKDDTEKTMAAAELFLFRSGAWTVKHPLICRGGNGNEHGMLPSEWNTSSVFPVGDRILCWVDISDSGGILFCDVLEESPCLHYVPFPSVPYRCFGRRVCATVGVSALMLVNISPRCCCGSAGASDCQRSHHAYTINTWTLRMDDGMEWAMDGMLDATELWSLDTYKGLPRVPLGFPVMSMYEPHVICFALCESYHVKYGGDQTLWLLMLDMRSKTIQSVSRYKDSMPGRFLISSNVSYYFNPYPTCSSDGTLTGQSHIGQMVTEEKKKDGNYEEKKKEDDGTNYSMLQSPCKPSAEPTAQAYDEILAAFREIPSYGFARDDMLKAYAILSGDNGHHIRSLLRLPKNLRKDWLLMGIKVDDA